MNVPVPVVGIGMTLHNRAAYLPQAIETLLAQSFSNFTLVLVDDGSQDESAEIAGRYVREDARVEYVRLPERRGMVEAWRAAFDRATTRGQRYFAWASDHDRWHSEWLATLAGVLDAHPAVVLAYPLTQRIDPDGASLAKPARQFETIGVTDLNRRWRLLNRSDSVAAGDMVYGLMRTQAVRDAGIFRHVLCPDRLLVAELTLRGEVRQVPEVLWYRRQFAVGSVDRQRDTLFPPGTRPPSRLVTPWWMHARSLWQVYGGSDASRSFVPRPTMRMLVIRYAAAFAWRHYAKSSVQHGILTALGWPRWLYKRLKHAVLLAVYGVLVALRQIGVTRLVERLCERFTGRPRPWRGHA